MASVFGALSDGIHTASPQDIAWVAASSVRSRLRTRPPLPSLCVNAGSFGRRYLSVGRAWPAVGSTEVSIDPSPNARCGPLGTSLSLPAESGRLGLVIRTFDL